MTRETENSYGTGFKEIVYGDGGMAKETVGVRPPQAIAEQVKEYAQTHEISRTEAIELFIRTGLQTVGSERNGRAYTVRIREVEHARDRPLYSGGWKSELRKADRWEGVYDSTEALSARLPGELVRKIEEYAAENGLAKSVAAENLMTRGLKEDPLPQGSEDPIPEHRDYSDTSVKTVELDAEEAELFRRCRLQYKKGPSETVNWLIGATYSTSSARVGWEKPEEE
jgi:hypothetical protein